MSTAQPTMLPTTQPAAKKNNNLVYVGGAICIVVLLVGLFLLFRRGKPSAAGPAQAPPLDKAQLLAAHAAQLHKDLAGFQ